MSLLPVKWLDGPDKMGSQSGFGLQAIVWRPCFKQFIL